MSLPKCFDSTDQCFVGQIFIIGVEYSCCGLIRELETSLKDAVISVVRGKYFSLLLFLTRLAPDLEEL